MKRLFLISFVFSCSFLASAQNHRIYGIIKDEISGEVLIGANIYDTLSLRGTVSSKDGFYSLELKSPASFIIYTYVGYKNRALKLNRINDTLINIYLTPGNELDEVSISPKKQNISVYDISKEQLVNTAVLGGEPDLMKYLQLLPGIQPGNEGTGSIHVRGGGPGENLVLLDRVPLYYINHLGGFVSIFNPYIIHNASIYTGNFPAEYGGRISSALDVTMKDGNVEKIKGEASIGLISSKIAMDGPLKNEKLSFVLSARRTYLDALLVPFFKLVSPKTSLGYNFYDLNGKINYRMNEKNTFQVSAYTGDDRLSYKHKDDGELYSMKNIWGNSFISFQHKSIVNSAIQVTNQLIFSRYRLKTTHLLELDETNDREKVEDHKFFFSGIRDAGFRSDWMINMSSSWDVKTGLHLFYHKFAPAVEGDIIHNKGSFFNIRDLESNYYLDNLFYVTDKLDIRGGMRITAYKKTEKTWFLTEPRFSTTYRIKDNISFISAWSRMYQFVHQLKSTGNTLNPEIWLPVMENLPPSMSDIFSIGTTMDINDSKYGIQFEAYYREMSELVEYAEGELFISSSTNWYSKLESGGSGKSYGIELFLEKKAGRLGGNLSYSFSRSFRQFSTLNNGKVFPYNYDRPHSIKLNLNYPVSKRVKFNFVWICMSGLPITVPIAKQEILNTPVEIFVPDDEVYIYSERNAYRIKPYHRMDIAVNYIPKNRKRDSSWSFSVYNVYNRKNPLYYKFYFDSFDKIAIQEAFLFPIIPSFSYNVKF